MKRPIITNKIFQITSVSLEIYDEGEKNMDIIYRKAKEEDAAALLLHLHAVGGETDNLSFGTATFNISTEKEARFIAKFSNSKRDVMFVAIDGDTVVGNAVVESNKVTRYAHRAEISISVLKDYWGKGIGTRLMQMMIDFAKDVGLEILYLEVRADNERAIGLYQKFGFNQIGIYDRFFKINEKYYDACLMTLKL